MKLICFIRNLGRGGAERQVSLLASGLKNNNYDVIVLTYYSNENIMTNPLYAKLINNQVKVLSLNKSGRYDLIGFLYRFIKVIINEKPDVIYSFFPSGNIISCFAKIFHQTIRIFWGRRSSDLELNKYSLNIKIEHKIEKLFLKVPEVIICNSNRGYDYLLKLGYPENKLHIIHNGVDIDVNKNQKSMRCQIFENFPIIDADIVIGAVGRIDYSKDYDVLINAARIIINENNKVKFVVVGRVLDKIYMEKLQQMVYNLELSENFFFLQETNDVASFYNSINIFVSSSYTEGFSNVIAEAMFSGLPCVATNAGDSEILLNKSGVVVDRRDPVALAQGILNVLNLSKKDFDALGKSAHERVIQKFSVQQLVENTELLLRKK